jgi:hypothetical protein
MYSVKEIDLKILPEEWLDHYSRFGIDLKSIKKEKDYYWDKTVLDYITGYKNTFFTREAIWDKNWKQSARRLGYSDIDRFGDPRRFYHRGVHSWLKKTQSSTGNILIRVIDKILIKLFRF